jgi:peptide deformylase
MAKALGVGIAAPHVGALKRLVVIQLGNYPGPCANWDSLIPCWHGPQRS